MAKYYGVLQGSRGEATRCGSRSSGLTAIVASWAGAVRVTLADATDGTEMARVELVPWHGRGVSKTLYYGPVETGIDDTHKTVPRNKPNKAFIHPLDQWEK